MNGYKCAACPKFSEKDLKCSRCNFINYCSKECQITHWKVHKNTCFTPGQRQIAHDIMLKRIYEDLSKKISGNIYRVAAHYGQTGRGAVKVTIPETIGEILCRGPNHYAHLNWVNIEDMNAKERELAEKMLPVSSNSEVVLVIYELRDDVELVNIALDNTTNLTMEKIKQMHSAPGEDWTIVIDL